ncbi:GILT-like protein 1 [Ixodes scapularis]|uniref:GILT-like protein 1 n=1 Tax=Ixodes scapularis TaxID=6945 RepID=UPI001AA00475|nr:GILT-like protein 1 [Ixodes scapularis]
MTILDGLAALCLAVLICFAKSQEAGRLFPEDLQWTNEIGDNHLDAGRKVNVTLFYESMCPYSREFITDQLYPTYELLRGYMVVVLVPFGNGHIDNKTLRNGKTYVSITCQHGVNECKGNKIEACAIKKYKMTSLWLPFVACISRFPDPHKQGKMCADSFHLEWSAVGQCADGKEGQDLLYQMGRLTEDHRPPINYVPYIDFDGVHDQKAEDEARGNLLGVVCKKLGDVKPKVCSGH